MEQYTVIDSEKVAHPHTTDIKFDTAPNGDPVVRLKNPRGDDYSINMKVNGIDEVNSGKFNLKGAEFVYHKGLKAEEVSSPGGYMNDDNCTSYF